MKHTERGHRFGTADVRPSRDRRAMPATGVAVGATVAVVSTAVGPAGRIAVVLPHVAGTGHADRRTAFP